jgi:diguanylate cyclase (GGDEF)-like protein
VSNHTDEQDMQIRLSELAKQYGDHPLFTELQHLAQQYHRLERRLNKVARIGDIMQSQIMELNQKLEQKASRDGLTGLLNRSGVYQRINAVASYLYREQQPFALLLLDLDFFKQINDTFGHQTGDRILIELASELQRNLRAYDCCARWGGEEFLVVLPDSSHDAMLAVAQKILQGIRQLSMPTDALKNLTASIGCYLCLAPEAIDDSIRKADLAMYEAKAQGRNQVVVYSPALEKTNVVL